MKLKLLIVFIYTVSISVFAKNETYSYYVTITDTSFKINSPKKFESNISLVLDNKTLTRQLGQIIKNGVVIRRVTTQPGKSTVVDIKLDKSDQLHYLPLSPSYEQIHLKIGKGAYEIPEKR